MFAGLKLQVQQQKAPSVQFNDFAPSSITARKPLTSDVAIFSKTHPNQLHFGADTPVADKPVNERVRAFFKAKKIKFDPVTTPQLIRETFPGDPEIQKADNKTLSQWASPYEGQRGPGAKKRVRGDEETAESAVRTAFKAQKSKFDADKLRKTFPGDPEIQNADEETLKQWALGSNKERGKKQRPDDTQGRKTRARVVGRAAARASRTTSTPKKPTRHSTPEIVQKLQALALAINEEHAQHNHDPALCPNVEKTKELPHQSQQSNNDDTDGDLAYPTHSPSGRVTGYSHYPSP